jgi:DNA modification methylase
VSGEQTLRLEWRVASELEPNPLNWRKHPSRQLEGLAEVLDRVGWAGALLYNERTGRLVDGHARRELRPEEKVPVLIGNWTEEQEREILATLDPLGAVAVADAEVFKALVDQLREDGSALEGVARELALTPIPSIPEPEVEKGPPPPLPDSVTVLEGDCIEQLATLEAKSVHCVVTSPPYWGLRDYGVDGQIGLEESVEAWVAKMVEVFRGVRRVLRDDGTLWLNLGDCYAGGGRHSEPTKYAAADDAKVARPQVRGLKLKDLVGQPWRVAFALQADGWYLRSAIIWHKPNPMPESVTDRPTSSHEYVFLLTKSARYYYDADAVRLPVSENNTGEISVAPHGDHVKTGGHRKQERRTYDRICGANLRDVWTIATHAYPDAHFATFPPKLVEPCVKAGTSERGCCPECGAAVERVVELTDEYAALLKSDGAWTSEDGKPNKETKRQESSHPSNVPPKHNTVGWRNGCDHKFTQSVPCVVLDPFGGSGTTAEVALAHGCNAILIELNPEYAKQIRRRLGKARK